MVVHIHNKSAFSHNDHIIVQKIASWICNELNLAIKKLDIIYINDEQMRTMHQQYLNDDAYTDVMTFNLGNEHSIEAEIYISFERVRENADKFNASLINELSRLVIHACLHLGGYDDKNTQNRHKMKMREEYFLARATIKYIN